MKFICFLFSLLFIFVSLSNGSSIYKKEEGNQNENDQRNVLGTMCERELTPTSENKYVDVPIESGSYCGLIPRTKAKCGDNCEVIYYHNEGKLVFEGERMDDY